LYDVLAYIEGHVVNLRLHTPSLFTRVRGQYDFLAGYLEATYANDLLQEIVTKGDTAQGPLNGALNGTAVTAVATTGRRESKSFVVVQRTEVDPNTTLSQHVRKNSQCMQQVITGVTIPVEFTYVNQ
jgi:hypothetical protein